MKDRIITLALSAAVAIGIGAPAFAQVSAEAQGIANNDNLIADCMIQGKRCFKRVYKKTTVKKAKKVAISKPVEKIVRTETEQTVEKPAVVEAPAPAVAAVEETAAPCPAVCAEQPVIIDRFEKRHRSLIHLGLFPFSLFGQ
jgi:hypothetical protein